MSLAASSLLLSAPHRGGPAPLRFLLRLLARLFEASARDGRGVKVWKEAASHFTDVEGPGLEVERLTQNNVTHWGPSQGERALSPGTLNPRQWQGAHT